MISRIKCIVRNLKRDAVLTNGIARNGANIQVSKALARLLHLAIQPKLIGLVILVFLAGGHIVNGRRPSYAQSALPSFADSWNGVHSFLDFDPAIPWTTASES